MALENGIRRAFESVAVTLDDDRRIAYRVDGVLPHVVVLPDSLEAVAAVVSLAHRHGIAVSPWGGGSHQSVGFPPRTVEMVLSLERLNSVLTYEPDDLTVSVRAGARVADLAARLAVGRHMLPLDVPAAHPATVGGMVATDLGGPRAAHYGACRDFLIGARVVLADGSISTSGGMVVKNVTGYDLHKLHIGALGSLGVVVEANFKVIPIPAVDTTLVIRGCRVDHAFDLCSELRRSALAPSAVTILGGRAIQLGRRDNGPSHPRSDETWPSGVSQSVEQRVVDILIRCEGRDESVARHVRDIGALAGRLRSGAPEEIRGNDADALWTRVVEFGHGWRNDDLRPGLTLRLRCMPSAAPVLYRELVQAATAERLEWSIVGHVNQASFTLELRPGKEDVNWGLSLVHIRRRLASWWPSALYVESQRQAGSDHSWLGQVSQPAIWRRLKSTFDPAGILNPGRHIADR